MRAISSMATREVLAAIADAAVTAGLPALEIESVGGVDAEQRVAAGEAFDLVFLASGALARLADGGHVDPVTVTPLVLSQVAVAVPSGDAGDVTGTAAVPPQGVAFPDAAGVRDALRAAHRIGYSTGPSGTALVRLIDEWGLTAEVGERLVQARPGIPVAASLAGGDVDLGFQQLSELVGAPGVRILGVLPADCAIETVFSGAVAATAADPRSAADLLAAAVTAAAGGLAADHHFGVPA